MNAVTDLEAELSWFSTLIRARLNEEGPAYRPLELENPAAPVLSGNSPYAECVQAHALSPAERAIFMLAVAPHLWPELLDPFLLGDEVQRPTLTETGGRRGNYHNGFLPTLQTALFLLGGSDFTARQQARTLCGPGSKLVKKQLIGLAAAPGEPLPGALLNVSQATLEFITTGTVHPPEFSNEFPARLVTTEMEWSDLVLPAATLDELERLCTWRTHAHEFRKTGTHFTPGCRALFWGETGTGKSMATLLLGKRTGMPVCRVDLPAVLSRYIGETEKNIARIFEKAESRRWILFFDEADALFGKRTGIAGAHDRYSNQEISFLLQRIEEYDGIVILATNLRQNMDEALARRFQHLVFFPQPEETERLRLWEKYVPAEVRIDEEITLSQVARHYRLNGAAIMCAVQRALLCMYARKDTTLLLRDLYEGIGNEHVKMNRQINTFDLFQKQVKQLVEQVK